jgi:hypothetical protein
MTVVAVTAAGCGYYQPYGNTTNCRLLEFLRLMAARNQLLQTNGIQLVRPRQPRHF